MCRHIVIGLCLFCAPAFAEWPQVPNLDLDAACPHCPSGSATKTDWVLYHDELEEFREFKLDTWWNKAVNDTYRNRLEVERQTFDLELQSGKLPFDEYKRKQDEYQSRVAQIEDGGDLFVLYKLGIAKYRDGIDLYKQKMEDFRRYGGWNRTSFKVKPIRCSTYAVQPTR